MPRLPCIACDDTGIISQGEGDNTWDEPCRYCEEYNDLTVKLKSEQDKIGLIKQTAKKFLSELDVECMRWLRENAYGTEGSPVPRHRGAKALWNKIKKLLEDK